MASHAFVNASRLIDNGSIDYLNDTIKARLLMTNTSAGTDNSGVADINDLGTQDKHDGSSYADITLTTKTITESGVKSIWGADNITFSSLGAGTRDIEGVLIFKFVTDDTDSIPICWNEFSSAQAHGSTADFPVAWDSTNKVMDTST